MKNELPPIEDDETLHVNEIRVEPIDEIMEVSGRKVYKPFTAAEKNQARRQLESIARRLLTPVLLDLKKTLATTIGAEKDDEAKRYAEAEKVLSALCIVYRRFGVFALLKKPDKPTKEDIVLVPDFVLAEFAENFRNDREKTPDILKKLMRTVKDEFDNCIDEIEDENLGYILPTYCQEGSVEFALNERASIFAKHDRREKVRKMPTSNKKPESGMVFGIINRMEALGYLPKAGSQWLPYYQLKFGTESAEFDHYDIESAKAYIKKQGLSLPVFLQFLNEYIRRKTGEQIYSHPVTIQTKDGEETLQIPIYGTRDYGEFSGVVLMCYRLAHPECPADTQPGAFRVTSLPCALAVVERNSVSKCVFVDPFRLENGERRVASLAFGEGAKDKSTTFKKWKLLPDIPGTLPGKASMLPPLPFEKLGKENAVDAAVWSVKAKGLALVATRVRSQKPYSLPPLPHGEKTKLTAEPTQEQKRRGCFCLLALFVIFFVLFVSVIKRCPPSKHTSEQPVSTAQKEV